MGPGLRILVLRIAGPESRVSGPRVSGLRSQIQGLGSRVSGPRVWVPGPDFRLSPQKHLSQVFVVFQKYPTKMISSDFRKVITISDKIDEGPLEILKKLNVFWEQCTDINQACHEYQWADICVRVLASQRSSKPNSRCILLYFQ